MYCFELLSSFKKLLRFKVKLTPGTGKRGKAARTALAVFLKDKAASQR